MTAAEAVAENPSLAGNPEAPVHERKVDELGRSYATGKRKDAVARVWIKPGSGRIIIEGAVITEQVFAWKGMGSLFIEGLNNVDPYPVMGFLLVTSIVIIFMNAVADIMYAYLDPRIRR